MNLGQALRLLARRWRIITVITVIAIAGATGYSLTQTPRYQATATVLVHPSSDATTPSVFSDELNLLSYGSLTQTFASLARSPGMIRSAADSVGVPADAAGRYSATGALLPQTTVLEVSVDGPDPAVVVRLANQLVADVSTETKTYFHIIDLTPLDPATAPAVRTQPRTARNIAFGGAAGLIVGALVAAVIRLTRRNEGQDAQAPQAGTPAASLALWLGDRLPTDDELAGAGPGPGSSADHTPW